MEVCAHRETWSVDRVSALLYSVSTGVSSHGEGVYCAETMTQVHMDNLRTME